MEKRQQRRSAQKVVQQGRPARTVVYTAVIGKQLHQKWGTEYLRDVMGEVTGFEVVCR